MVELVEVEVVLVVVAPVAPPSVVVVVVVTSSLTNGSLVMAVTASVVILVTSFSRVLISSSFSLTTLPVVRPVSYSVTVVTVDSKVSTEVLRVDSSFLVCSILVSMIFFSLSTLVFLSCSS